MQLVTSPTYVKVKGSNTVAKSDAGNVESFGLLVMYLF